MLYLSLISYLVITLLYFSVNDIVSLIAIRLLHGVAFGMASTTTGIISAEIVPNERRGEGTGYYALSTTLATAIGPSLGMFLIQYGGFNIILIVCATVTIAGFIAVFPFKDFKVVIKNDPVNTKRFALSNIFEAKALPISILVTLACCGEYEFT